MKLIDNIKSFKNNFSHIKDNFSNTIISSKNNINEHFQLARKHHPFIANKVDIFQQLISLKGGKRDQISRKKKKIKKNNEKKKLKSMKNKKNLKNKKKFKK